MIGLRIYLHGTSHGRYGAGTRVLAHRNTGEIIEGKYYTIAEIEPGVGMCGRNLLITLEEVSGEYVRNDFRVNK